jgi:hypothetical protein
MKSGLTASDGAAAHPDAHIQYADLTTHRIEGIAREGNTPFSVPLFSHIKGNLWMGGCPVDSVPSEFKFIVSLYPWGEYRTAAHQVLTFAYLFDSHEAIDADILAVMVAHINVCRKRALTLVHCQAGLNRSGLLTALALKAGGMSGRGAVDLLRKRRCSAVLCNRTFEAMVLGPSQKLQWPDDEIRAASAPTDGAPIK